MFVLWLLGLGVINLGRGLVLWRERRLLFELGSTLSPFALTACAILFVWVGLALFVAAGGLWWRQKWAAGCASIAIPLYFGLIQAYTWLFVRTGLMWERRWVSLIGSLLGTAIGVGTLMWPKSREWLGIWKRSSV